MSLASNRQFKNKAGFTLIELLIVIAVIGILSGIIMVSFDGAKDKARIAKSLQFSNSVQNAIGVDMVGRWNFEKIEGGKVIDTSGYGNDGVVHGATLVPGLEQLGNALSFDGVDDYVDCNTAVNDISSVAGTVELWVKATDNGNGYPFQSNANTRTYIRRSASRFDVSKGDPIVSIGFPNTSIGEWHHLVLAWDNGIFWGYQDGALIDSKNFSSSVTASSVRIGQHFSGGESNSFGGLIDEVRIYNAALSSSAIREQYLAGLDKLLVSGQITEDDYQQRIAELNSNYVARK